MLSHNLYTVLHIPHDPVALEEHFRDDDDGPVSSQGYMPYLNKYILDKVGPSSWGASLPQSPNTWLPTPTLHSPSKLPFLSAPLIPAPPSPLSTQLPVSYCLSSVLVSLAKPNLTSTLLISRPLQVLLGCPILWGSPPFSLG